MSAIHSRPRPHPSPIPVAVEEITSRLDVLAGELGKRQWSAHVTAEPWRRPRLFARHPADPARCSRFLVAPQDVTGAWMFWDQQGSPLAPASAPCAAADRILQTPADRPD